MLQLSILYNISTPSPSYVSQKKERMSVLVQQGIFDPPPPLQTLQPSNWQNRAISLSKVSPHRLEKRFFPKRKSSMKKFEKVYWSTSASLQCIGTIYTPVNPRDTPVNPRDAYSRAAWKGIRAGRQIDGFHEAPHGASTFTVDSPQIGRPILGQVLKVRIIAATDALPYKQTPFLIQNKSSKRGVCVEPGKIRFEACQLYFLFLGKPELSSREFYSVPFLQFSARLHKKLPHPT
jgi:hypothetical protein